MNTTHHRELLNKQEDSACEIHVKRLHEQGDKIGS